MASSYASPPAPMPMSAPASAPLPPPEGTRTRVAQNSVFRPWNSYVAKKAAAEAASAAALHANSSVPPPAPAVKRLTVTLIDTYECINYAYYHARSSSTAGVLRNPAATPAFTTSTATSVGSTPPISDRALSQRLSITSLSSQRVTSTKPTAAAAAAAAAATAATGVLPGTTSMSSTISRTTTETGSSPTAASPSAGFGTSTWTSQHSSISRISRRASSSATRSHGKTHQRRPSVASAISPSNLSANSDQKNNKSLSTPRHAAIPDRPSPASSTAPRAVSNAGAASHASSIATALSSFFHGSGSFTRHSSSVLSSSQSARSSVDNSPNLSRSNTHQNPIADQSLSHSASSQRSRSTQSRTQKAPALDVQAIEPDTKPKADAPESNHSQAPASSLTNTAHSPHSVQYCDANYDYIVRPGDMFHNRYILEKVIGRGSFGQVVRAYDTRMKAHVAIKIIKNNSLYVEQALSEVRMTAYLNRIDPDDCHSIMRIFDRFIFRGHQCLVLELLSFSLYDLLRSTEFYGVSLNLVRKFSRQILNCLAFLGRPDVNIAHCDLKPENVLLRHPQRSAIKVVDFGASCRVNDSMFTYVQSRFYRAPEVILGLPYDTQVDVWSLGCMLVELHTGYPLFAGQDEADQMAVIVERLGMPPKYMLDEGKKTHLFFDRVESPAAVKLGGTEASGDTAVPAYTWTLKPDIGKKEGIVIPGSKPIQAFVDELTSSSGGRRKRVSGGHSEEDYQVFLNLSLQMLCYDPKERITSSLALLNPFHSGSGGSGARSGTSGRESPSHVNVPNLSSSVDDLPAVEPGRAAPVHPRVGHGGVAPSDLASKQDNFGGALRLSKSESAIAPVITSGFGFHSSEWAEEVGIDPPRWRSAGPPPMRLLRGSNYQLVDEDETDSSASHCEYLAGAGGGGPICCAPREDSHRYIWRRERQVVARASRVVSRFSVSRPSFPDRPNVAWGHSALLNKIATL